MRVRPSRSRLVTLPGSDPGAAGGNDILDEAALHDDRGALDGIAAGAVDQQRMGQERDARHGASCSALRGRQRDVGILAIAECGGDRAA
jgi:hypothetical protein